MIAFFSIVSTLLFIGGSVAYWVYATQLLQLHEDQREETAKEETEAINPS